MEDAGLTHQVAVKLNREIAQSFTVKVSGSKYVIYNKLWMLYTISDML